MANFFANLPPDTAAAIDQLSRLHFELRENRRAVLQAHGVDSHAALLRQIEAGTVAEHPAYEHWLSARILEETRETVRELLGEQLQKARRP